MYPEEGGVRWEMALTQIEALAPASGIKNVMHRLKLTQHQEDSLAPSSSTHHLPYSSLIMTATSTATESKTSDEQVRYTIMFVRKVKNTIITHPIPYLLPFASTNSLGLMQ
jgi:hypothetical protein